MEDKDFFDGFRKMAEDGLKLWDSPSVSVGVVKESRSVMFLGFD